MTDELDRLLNQRDGVPPIDDEPSDDSPGDMPGELDDDEEA